MDHPLRTISYIADIGNIVVLMARRRMARPDSPESEEASEPQGQESKRQYKMICHVFESEDVSQSHRAFALTTYIYIYIYIYYIYILGLSALTR